MPDRVRALSADVQFERSAREIIAPMMRPLSDWQAEAVILRGQVAWADRHVPMSRSLHRARAAELLAEVEAARAAFVASTAQIAAANCVRNAASAFQRLVTDLGELASSASPQAAAPNLLEGQSISMRSGAGGTVFPCAELAAAHS